MEITNWLLVVGVTFHSISGFLRSIRLIAKIRQRDCWYPIWVTCIEDARNH